MRKHVRLIIVVCLIVLAAGVPRAPLFAQVALEKKELALINRAVFEVVVLKQTRDSLTYERPLPLDQLPYTERTDKYRSLGTAFAIGPREFVTAAHVLRLGARSQENDYSIRDVSGRVFAIDTIVKYSDRRDFVVFTVKDRPAGDSLALNPDPEMNEKVYAVGNALGEGIVIRDGLYTSNTPEDLDGEWKWLRFSAAASPGNSGGPLLDAHGSVIGIVLRKSPSENLNIALPIREVTNAKAGVASIYHKMKYTLDNMRLSKIDTLKREIALPRPFQALNDELASVVDQFTEGLARQLLAENRDRIFPNGKESHSLLNAYYHENFPRLISQGEDGNWDALAAYTKELSLDHNGLITIGRYGHSMLVQVRKPDDISLQQFYRDSKVFMDTLLKGFGITRQVGLDKVKITSLGKAVQEFEYQDTYKRKWLVKVWRPEYSNTSLITVTLPVPGGAVTLMRSGPTAIEKGQMVDMKILTDFIYLSYCGSLKEWREFLAMKELLPEIFSSLQISFDPGGQISLRSRRLAFSLDQTSMNITEKSDLHLSFGYFQEGGRVVWDLKEVSAGEDADTVTNYKVTRFAKPPDDVSDKEKSTWKKISVRQAPYNKTAILEDNSTKIASVAARKDSAPGGDVLYSLQYRKEGTWPEKDMLEKLEAFQKNVSVFE